MRNARLTRHEYLRARERVDLASANCEMQEFKTDILRKVNRDARGRPGNCVRGVRANVDIFGNWSTSSTRTRRLFRRNNIECRLIYNQTLASSVSN